MTEFVAAFHNAAENILTMHHLNPASLYREKAESGQNPILTSYAGTFFGSVNLIDHCENGKVFQDATDQ